MSEVPGALELEATPEEAALIRKLRNKGGWWGGDRNALKVIREYRMKLTGEYQLERRSLGERKG